MVKFIDARLSRADADVRIRVNLLESFELGLGSNKLPLKSRRRYDHSLTLLGNIDRRVLTRILAEILLRRLEFVIYRIQAFFKKYALPVSRRSRKLCHECVEFVHICGGNSRGALWIAIANGERDDSAFPLLGYVRIAFQSFSS